MSTAVIGAPEFRARNGIVVRPSSNGGIEVGRPGYRDYTPPEATFALEEFFQFKRDQELGRWRWPENPHYVIYPSGNGGQVTVVDESNGERSHYSRSLCAETAPPSLDGIHAAAHAYFVAHPERKPWQDAKPGEVWVLDIEGTDYAAVREYGADFKLSSTNLIAPRDERIVAGRRIWPEDAS